MPYNFMKAFIFGKISRKLGLGWCKERELWVKEMIGAAAAFI